MKRINAIALLISICLILNMIPGAMLVSAEEEIPDAIEVLPDTASDDTDEPVLEVSENVDRIEEAELDSVPETVDNADSNALSPALIITAGTNVLGLGEETELHVEMVGMEARTPIRAFFNTAELKVAGIEGDDQTILVTGKKITEAAKIRIMAGGVSETVVFEIKEAPIDCRLTAERSSITIGESTALTAMLNSGSSSVITYSSSDESVATVDENGIVTGTGAGKAEITASTYVQDVYAKTEISVYDAPAAISFDESSYLVAVDGTISARARATAVEDRSSLADITYTSSDENVFTVDPRLGTVKGVGTGSAVLSAESANGLRAEVTVHVCGISFATSTIRMVLADSLDLFTDNLIRVEGASASDIAFSFDSSSSKVVSVDAKGVLQAITAGSSRITVSTDAGLSGTISVIVYGYPDSIDLSANELLLGVGMSDTVKASFKAGTYVDYTVSSADETVATVDEKGNITAVGAGETDILFTATSGSLMNTPAVCRVVVKPAPDLVEFEQNKYTVCADDSLPTGLIIPDETLATIKYESSDKSVFTVSSSGRVWANENAEGKSAVLTAKTQKAGVEAQTTIKVVGAPDRIAFEHDIRRISVGVGESIRIPKVMVYCGSECADSVRMTYKSDTPSCADVSRDGVITGVSAGSCMITVTTYNNRAAILYVTVRSGSEETVSISADKTEFYIGTSGVFTPSSFDLQAKAWIGGAASESTLYYDSSDSGVASVDTKGIITPVTFGSCEVSANVHGAEPARCLVNVWKASKTVSFDVNSVIGVGQTVQLVPIFDDVYSSSQLTYRSSNPAVLSVDATGLLSALTPGEATITVTGLYGLKTELDFTVQLGPDTMRFPSDYLGIRVGESTDLSPIFTGFDGYYEELTYSDYDQSIVAFSGNTVTAIAVGETVVNAVTCNGLTASLRIKVIPDDTRTDVLSISKACIITGDSYDLSNYFVPGVQTYLNGGYTLSSNNSAITINDCVITAGNAPANVQISLTIGGTVVDTMSVKVIDEIVPTVLVNNKDKTGKTIELYTADAGVSGGATAQIEVLLDIDPELANAVMLSKLDLDVELENNTIVSMTGSKVYRGWEGTLRAGNTEGTAKLIITSRGIEYEYTVKVSRITYRALIIGEFNNSLEGALPFSIYNTTGMEDVLSSKYATRRMSNNPRKEDIRSNIVSMFADADETDVSVVYIISHGNTNTSDGTYYFSIPTSKSASTREIVTSTELFTWLSGIKGNVVLLLDSCASGVFITDMRDELNAAGNIAVLTAQGIHPGSWFMKSSTQPMEFLTAIMMRGLGSSAYSTMLAKAPSTADTDGNGVVTLSELCEYSVTWVCAAVKYYYSIDEYRSKGYFYIGYTHDYSGLQKLVNNGWNQVPQKFIPKGMEELPFLP